MSAKEMFEKLGYELSKNDKKYIIYENKICDTSMKIIFDLDFKIVKKSYNRNDASWIHLQELQAINKQVEELGWLGSDKE